MDRHKVCTKYLVLAGLKNEVREREKERESDDKVDHQFVSRTCLTKCIFFTSIALKNIKQMIYLFCFASLISENLFVNDNDNVSGMLPIPGKLG